MRQAANQSANAWRSAFRHIFDHCGGLSACPLKPTYIAKYYSAKGWRSAWRPAPVWWRSDPTRPSRPPHRHGSHGVAA